MSSKSDAKASKVAKRSRDKNHNVVINQKKKQKLSVNGLQLVDMNNDCLEVIFEHFHVNDLVNVAECDERFYSAAESVFSRRYRNVEMHLNFGEHDCLCPLNRLEIKKGIAVSLFRRFGHFVTDLLINFSAQHEIDIENSLFEHCSDTLTKLQLIWCCGNNFETLIEPFGKIEELRITRSLLGPKISQLNHYFPNLVSLKLCHIELSQPKLLEVHFSQLKQLEIQNRDQTLPPSTIVKMIRANAQIESLNLDCNLDINLLQTIGICLQQLEELILYAPSDRFYCFGDEKVHFKMVKKFTLSSSFIHGEFLVNMPFVFEKLHELMLTGFNEFKGQMLAFIKQNSKVSKLSLMSRLEDWDDLEYEDLESIIQSMPKLNDLEFCADAFINEEVIELLALSEELKTVKLWFIDPVICAQIREQLKANWSITAHSVRIICCEPQYYLSLYRKN